MALNIGSINFGVDANTTGLKKAISALQKFQAQNNRIAASQVKAANRVKVALENKDKAGIKSAQAAVAANNKLISGLARQESAVKKAFQATLQLQQAQRKAGAPIAQVGRQTQAFKRLTSAMTSGVLTTRQFAQAQDAFANATGRGSRELRKFNASAKAGNVGKLTNTLRNLESSAVLAVGPLSGIGARIRSLGAIAGRTNLAMVALFAGITAGVVAFAKLAQGAINAGRVFEEANARFLAASGSVQIANAQMKFVIKTALELGLRVDTSAKAFSRLSAAARGTKLEGEGVRRVFLAVSKAAAALRLGQGEVEGAFRAIEQIMSKGSVQAEELRGQLGERLPGAFRLAAESMGVTTRELGNMLKAGEVLSDDFLLPFASTLEDAFGEAAKANISSFTGSLNNLVSQGLLFSRSFNEAFNISKIFIGGINAVASVVKAVRENLDNLQAAALTAGSALLFMSRVAIKNAILAIAASIVMATRATWAFTVAILANPLGKMASLALRAAIAVTAVIATFFGWKAIISDTDAELDALEDGLKSLGDEGINAAEQMTTKFKSLTDELQNVADANQIILNILEAQSRLGPNFIGLLTTRFETLAKIEAFSADEMAAFTRKLLELGVISTPMLTTVDSLGNAFFEWMVKTQNTRIELEKTAAGVPILIGVMKSLEAIVRRNAELAKGQEAVDFFDNVTVAVEKFGAALKLTILNEEQQVIVLAAIKAALIDQIALEKALALARKASNELSGFKRMANALITARARVEELRKSNRALSEGPDSFEYFQKVTVPLDRFVLLLRKAGVAMEAIKILSAEYEELLDAQFEATDRFARANQQMAAAVVNGLEDIIIKGGSVTDMLHKLAKELLRVAIRALFLDKLQSSIFSFFQGGGGPSILKGGIGTGGGGKGGSHGGTFKIGGGGGVDNVPIFARPGEVINIQTPSQAAAGGGGGGNSVVVNQTNNFEGGITPATLIPILEENNRKVKGEFLDALDRGTFR